MMENITNEVYMNGNLVGGITMMLPWFQMEKFIPAYHGSRFNPSFFIMKGEIDSVRIYAKG